MCITFTSINAELKNFGVLLTAVGPDEVEKAVHFPGSDIRTAYGMNPASFLEKYGEDEKELFRLFNTVERIEEIVY